MVDDNRPRTIEGISTLPGEYDLGWCVAIVTDNQTNVRCKGCGVTVTLPTKPGSQRRIEIDHATEPLCPVLVMLHVKQSLKKRAARHDGRN